VTGKSLDQLLSDSLAGAGPAVKATFDSPQRRLDAAAFREFWRGTRMFAVATNAAEGAPHIAPVHVLLTDDDALEMAIFEDSARLRDLRRDPRISITTWGEGGAIAIVYGRAHELEGTRRPTRPGADGSERHVITMRIEMERVYAMRPEPRP
jgi:hypothetical protein